MQPAEPRAPGLRLDYCGTIDRSMFDRVSWASTARVSDTDGKPSGEGEDEDLIFLAITRGDRDVLMVRYDHEVGRYHLWAVRTMPKVEGGSP